MTRPVTSDCYGNEDKHGYLTECGHTEHVVQHCSIGYGSCQGFIVNWETWNRSDDFICEICEDCGYHYNENGELVQP